MDGPSREFLRKSSVLSTCVICFSGRATIVCYLLEEREILLGQSSISTICVMSSAAREIGSLEIVIVT